MTTTKLKTELNKAQLRVNNRNAKKFIDSVITKFNNTNEDEKATYPGEIFNFGWCEINLFRFEDGKTFETIRVSLP